MSDLLERLKHRDPAAQEQLRREMRPKLTRVCRKVLKAPAHVAETVEDTITDFLLGHVEALRHEEAIVKYLCLMALRRAQRVKRLEARFGELEEAPESSLRSEDAERTLVEAGTNLRREAQLTRCLRRVTPRVRQLLRLRFHHGVTLEAAGDSIGTSKQYVSRLLGKALGALRECMEEAA